MLKVIDLLQEYKYGYIEDEQASSGKPNYIYIHYTISFYLIIYNRNCSILIIMQDTVLSNYDNEQNNKSH